MVKQDAGFTLIEVMAVVAIIGILVAVAVPQYQDYIARSRMVEGMNLSSSAKLAVTEAFASRGTVPMDEATSGSFTFAPARSVKLIEVTPSGVIAIDYQISEAPEGKNTLHLVLVVGHADLPKLISYLNYCHLSAGLVSKQKQNSLGWA